MESQDAVYSIQKSQEFGHTAEKAQILPNTGKIIPVPFRQMYSEGSMQNIAFAKGDL